MKIIKNILACAAAWGLFCTATVWADTQTRVFGFGYNALGVLNAEYIEPDSPENCIWKDYRFDHLYGNYGNVVSVSTSSCPNAATPNKWYRYESTLHSSDGRFPHQISNGENQHHTEEYHPVFGTPTRLTDANGLATSWEYDGLGRKTRETRPDGTYTTWSYRLCSAANGKCPGSIGEIASAWLMTESSYAPDGRKLRADQDSFYDALDRILRVQTTDAQGNAIAQDTGYDSSGRLARRSNIYLIGTKVPSWTRYRYDVLNRVIEEQVPNGLESQFSVTTYAYSGLVTRITDPKGRVSILQKDARGNLVKVTDAAGQVATYGYDAQDNLVRVEAGGAVTTMTYDTRGRLTSMSDPAMGVWQYAYDPLGQLTWQKDGLGNITTMTYDLLGRMTKRVEADLVSEWTYDRKFDGSACGKGRNSLCEARSDNGYHRTHTYDALGRPVSTATTLDSAASPQTFTWSYDDAGRIATQTWPTGYQARYVYNARGFLASVSSGTAGGADEAKIEILERSPYGIPSKYRQGAALTTTKFFSWATNQLEINNVDSLAVPGSVQFERLRYDTIGNLSSRVYLSDGVNTQESFAYDNLDRLTRYTVVSQTVSMPKVVETRYDARGNITYKSDVGSYGYDAARRDRLLAIAPTTASGAQVAVSGTRTVSYTWDDAHSGAQTVGGVKVGNGNLQLQVSRDVSSGLDSYIKQVYSSFNMPSQIVRGAMNGTAQGPAEHTLGFVYGPEHQRIKQTVAGGPRAGTTWYLNGEDSLNLGYEKTVLSSGLTEHRHFLSAEGMTYAIHTQRSGVLGGQAGQEVNYLHQDHLGSVSLVTSAQGLVLERLSYDAWGKRRQPGGVSDPQDALVGVQTNRGFTQHEHLEELAWVHMNGRLYDPYVGRFASADPYVVRPYDLQGLNRYSYVGNRPLNGVDPTGFWSRYVGSLPATEVVGYYYDSPSLSQGINWDYVNYLMRLPVDFWRAPLVVDFRVDMPSHQATAQPVMAVPGTGNATAVVYRQGENPLSPFGSRREPSLGQIAGSAMGNDAKALFSSVLSAASRLAYQTFDAAFGGYASSAGQSFSQGSYLAGVGYSALGAVAALMNTNPVGAGVSKAAGALSAGVGRVAGSVGLGKGAVSVKTAGQLGREGEAAVRGSFDIGEKVTLSINGRTRIPDGVTANALSEVKNVQRLSLTQQLRDYLQYAKGNGLRFDLYTRSDTRLSGPLQQMIIDGKINLLTIPK